MRARPGPGVYSPPMLNRVVRAAIFATFAVSLYALNQSSVFEVAFRKVEALGAWAMPAFLLLHVLSVLAFIPSVVPTFAAGVLFGVGWSIPLTVLGAGMGAAIAFQLGRTTARGFVEGRYAHDPRFQALSKLARDRGWKIVAMARLTPLFPFSFFNYAFGVTSIKASHYLYATLLGTLPSNAVYVYLGAVTGDVAGGADVGRDRTPMEWVLLIGGLVVAVALAIYLRRVAAEAIDGTG